MKHMLEICDRSKQVLDVVHNRQADKQSKAKMRYDVKTKIAKFELGNLVLALQNISGKPLATKFDGLFKVLCLLIISSNLLDIKSLNICYTLTRYTNVISGKSLLVV